MFPIEFAIAGCEDVGRRWCRTGDVAKAIHSAALHVNAGEQAGRDAGLALLEQPVRLLSACDIACEKNYARRLQPREQGTEPRRHLGAIEAHDQQLADLSGD
jgi:hypothetical protein